MAIYNEVNDTKVTLDTLELGASTQVDIVLPSLKRFQDLADATDELKKSVAQNVDGIARVEQQKQDRLPQVDLDNIASIDRMKDDIKGKASQTEVNNIKTIVDRIAEIQVVKLTSANGHMTTLKRNSAHINCALGESVPYARKLSIRVSNSSGQVGSITCDNAYAIDVYNSNGDLYIFVLKRDANGLVDNTFNVYAGLANGEVLIKGSADDGEPTICINYTA